jgi:hypothetical protein
MIELGRRNLACTKLLFLAQFRHVNLILVSWGSYLRKMCLNMILDDTLFDFESHLTCEPKDLTEYRYQIKESA